MANIIDEIFDDDIQKETSTIVIMTMSKWCISKTLKAKTGEVCYLIMFLNAVTYFTWI